MQACRPQQFFSAAKRRDLATLLLARVSLRPGVERR